MSPTEMANRLKTLYVPANRKVQQQQQTSDAASVPLMNSYASAQPQPQSERTSPMAVAKAVRTEPPQQRPIEPDQFTSTPLSAIIPNDPSSSVVPQLRKNQYVSQPLKQRSIEADPFAPTPLSEMMSNNPSNNLAPQPAIQLKEKQTALKPPQQCTMNDPFEPTPLSEIMHKITRSNMVPQVTSFAPAVMQHQQQISSTSMQHQSISSTNRPSNSIDIAKQRKEQFLMFTRVLMKYLEQKDAEMHEQAKNVIRECAEKNKKGDPEYLSLTASMKRRLRALVGDFCWNKAEGYLAELLRQKRATSRVNGGHHAIVNVTNSYRGVLPGSMDSTSNAVAAGEAAFAGTKRRLEQSRRGGRKKQSFEKPPLPPMQKGKAMIVPTGFDALDMHYPYLNAADRTNVLCQLLPHKQHGSKMRLTSRDSSRFSRFTKKYVHDWRVQFEKKNSTKSTLWFMVSSFSDDIAAKIFNVDDDNNRKMSTEIGSSDNTDRDVLRNVLENDKNQEEDRKYSPPIGPLSSDVIDTLRKYFYAHVTRHLHKARLDNIEPIDEDKNHSTITCSICSDNFDAIDTVPCSSESEIHFFCKKCFASYATVTVGSGPIQCIKCPLPDCKSLFSVVDAKENLSQWDLLMIEHRETSRDRRVALAAKATLHCVCGVVAIITEEDMIIMNGRALSCPGKDCTKRYCCKCGNDDHGKEPCPPPAETMQWLDEHSKECPNCKNRIEKNGGCNHMTCQSSAGGCGHEFYWKCLCPYSKHKPGCKGGESRL